MNNPFLTNNTKNTIMNYFTPSNQPPSNNNPFLTGNNKSPSSFNFPIKSNNNNNFFNKSPSINNGINPFSNMNNAFNSMNLNTNFNFMNNKEKKYEYGGYIYYLPKDNNIGKNPPTSFGNNNFNITKETTEKQRNDKIFKVKFNCLLNDERFKEYSLEEIRINDYINSKIKFFNFWKQNNGGYSLPQNNFSFLNNGGNNLNNNNNNIFSNIGNNPFNTNNISKNNFFNNIKIIIIF